MTEIGPIERLHTGINGFDQVALGGLPAGRPTLVTGTTGSGKTIFAGEFLARGIMQRGEPGVFVTFEETPEDIRRNFASLGFPVAQWESDGTWAFVDATDDIAGEAPIIGAYDFGALMARIEHAIRRISATRVALDSLGAVFTRFADTAIVRQQTYRIAAALDELEVTSVITSERTSEYGPVSRYGVEEFVLDNVIILRNLLAQERRRRTIEVVKFGGARHRTGEWLFTIDPREGIIVLPLAFLVPPFAAASTVRVPSGNPGLDQMCGGGFFKDAIVLLTGPSGVGKTLASLSFMRAGIAAGKRCLAFTFDETREQVARNADGWGIDLDALEGSGMLRVECDYPEVASLEDHFIRIRRAIEEHSPGRLVIDPLSALERIVSPRALLDFVITLAAVVRQHGITTLLTSSPAGRFTPRLTPSIAGEVASFTDVSIALRYFEQGGEIHRAIAVLQTRGSAHDGAIRQVTIDADGMHIGGPVSGTIGILNSGASHPFAVRPPGSIWPQGPLGDD